MAWAGVADGTRAVVVDLPGSAAVMAGVKLASAGYRPVPLFNAIPDPAEWPAKEGPISVRSSLVDVRPIVIALVQQVPDLAAMRLGAEAPPVFLLDANRRGGDNSSSPGGFDNRSVSLPTDFPSGNLMRSRGIRNVVVVQPTGREPQTDLSHTLRRWQESGIQILIKSMDETADALPLVVKRPSGFRLLWHNSLATIGLKHSPFGGFGGRLPFSSSG
jgi:hypothetical protein